MSLTRVFPTLLLAICLVARGDPPTAASLAGTYRDDRLTAAIEADPGTPGAYRGTFTLGGTAYPMTGRATSASQLEGAFTDANGTQFKFTAELQNGTLNLTSGATTYHLAPAGATPAPPVNGGGGGGEHAGLAPARRHEYRVEANSNAILMMPELRDAPPPAWVKPGLRIVTYQADASIPGAGMVMVQDPNGQWVNKATGQRMALQENAGGGGHGFSVVDVVSVLPDAVVASVSVFLMFPPDNVPVLQGGFGTVTTPGCALDLWVHPQVMAKYLDLNGNGISTTRTPYKAAGKTYDSMWRQITGEGGATTVVYDVESGLKLHTAMCSSTASSNVNVGGQTQAMGGSTNLSQITLAGMRQVDSPWTKGRLPRALEGVRELTYDGIDTTLIPGAPAMNSKMHMVVAITGRGDDFVQCERTGVLMIGTARNDLGKTTVVSGPAQLAPLAIDPADLARVQKGQVLDKDPTTKGTVTVSQVGRDRRGTDVVVVTQLYPAAAGSDPQRVDTTYDRATGMMIGLAFNNPFLHHVTQLSLTGKR